MEELIDGKMSKPIDGEMVLGEESTETEKIMLPCGVIQCTETGRSLKKLAVDRIILLTDD